jgi:hypothetical protein
VQERKAFDLAGQVTCKNSFWADKFAAQKTKVSKELIVYIH